MVLAAGLGTRMRPLTNHRPKCLMPIMNQPLLGVWLERLAGWGVSRAVVNTHHLAPMVRGWLAQNQIPGLEALESHEPEILGTGGGLVAARALLGESPFLLVNADLVASAHLPLLMEKLASTGAAAVLGLVDDSRFNTVLADGNMCVRGFKGRMKKRPELRYRTYTGLAAMSPRFLDYLPPSGYSPLIDGLEAAINAGELVTGWELEGFWDNLGDPPGLWSIHRALAGHRAPELGWLSPNGPILKADDAHIHPQARVEGFCVLGAGARIDKGAMVKDSVFLPGAAASGGSRVQGAVLGDGFMAQGEIRGGAHA